MRVNPRLVKQHAKQVAPLGMLLWRQLTTASGSSSSSTDGRLSLTPAQIRQQMSVFASHSDAHKAFADHPDNRNLPNHLGVLTQLLTSHDNPLTISGSEVTDRWVSVAPPLFYGQNDAHHCPQNRTRKNPSTPKTFQSLAKSGKIWQTFSKPQSPQNKVASPHM